MVVGCWLLVVGCWLLAAGCWHRGQEGITHKAKRKAKLKLVIGIRSSAVFRDELVNTRGHVVEEITGRSPLKRIRAGSLYGHHWVSMSSRGYRRRQRNRTDSHFVLLLLDGERAVALEGDLADTKVGASKIESKVGSSF